MISLGNIKTKVGAFWESGLGSRTRNRKRKDKVEIMALVLSASCEVIW